jgi:hypothetical protein
MVAGDPDQGGATWAVLQYVLGLRSLGHDVLLVEPVDARRDPRTDAYFRAVVRRFGLDGRAALLVRDSTRTVGPAYERLRRWVRDADVVLNVSGMLRDESLLDEVPVRVFLDLDPAFNQLWHAVDGVDMGFELHNRFATIGLSLGSPGCRVPTCGRTWATTLQPVVLDLWPAAREPARDTFTTVANWRGYGSIDWRGVHFGQKAHSVRALIDLPERAHVPLALALAIHPDERADLAALRRHGWTLVDPVGATGSPDAYARFIRGSRGELGVAKSGYVASRCGWFSDRSACYLASGRPVVAQDTGWTRHLPAGEGLLAFATAEGAAAAIDEVARDEPRHRRAARALAEDLFDAATVLPRLLDAVA